MEPRRLRLVNEEPLEPPFDVNAAMREVNERMRKRRHRIEVAVIVGFWGFAALAVMAIEYLGRR